MRIVSLLPAATEVVSALGGESMLVGVSHECDWPQSVASVEVVTRSLELGPGSEEIDTGIRAALERALAIYDVLPEKLAALAPDLVITQDLCEVCAVPAKLVERRLAEIVGKQPTLIRLGPSCLADVFNDVTRIANAMGVVAAGRALRSELEARLRMLVVNPVSKPCNVLAIEWLSPVMLGGLWTPELIEFAGANGLVVAPKQPAPTVDPSELEALAPDVVLVKPCGYRIADSLSEIDLIQRLLPPHWPAVKAGRVFVVDGNQYFNRSGPRLVDSAELLAGLVRNSFDTSWLSRFSEHVVRLQLDGGELTIGRVT